MSDEVSSRLLRDAARATMPAEAGPACLDADTLAAWADEALGVREREAVESHAAGCARCQAMLAAMVTTTPPADPAPARAWWRMPAFAWLVPATALVLVVGVYVGTLSMGRRSNALPGAQMVPTTAHLPTPPPAVAAAPQTIAPTVVIATPPAQASTPGGGPVTAAPLPNDQLPASLAIAPRSESAGFAPQRGASASSPSPVSSASPASPAPPAAAGSQETAPRVENADAATRRQVEQRSAQRALVDAAPASPPRTGSPAGAPPAEAPTSQPPAADFATAAQGAAAMNRAAPFAMKSMASPPPMVVAPDASARWRLLPDGGIERSTDLGATWQPQATGVRVPLTAGAAPSSTVCWVVGTGGTVLLSTDGRTWRRLAFPDLVNLIAVSAADEKTATVTAAGGRTFTTTDGGKTWTR
jgi:hypothetical protein